MAECCQNVQVQWRSFPLYVTGIIGYLHRGTLPLLCVAILTVVYRGFCGDSLPPHTSYQVRFNLTRSKSLEFPLSRASSTTTGMDGTGRRVRLAEAVARSSNRRWRMFWPLPCSWTWMATARKRWSFPSPTSSTEECEQHYSRSVGYRTGNSDISGGSYNRDIGTFYQVWNFEQHYSRSVGYRTGNSDISEGSSFDIIEISELSMKFWATLQ